MLIQIQNIFPYLFISDKNHSRIHKAFDGVLESKHLCLSAEIATGILF